LLQAETELTATKPSIAAKWKSTTQAVILSNKLAHMQKDDSTRCKAAARDFWLKREKALLAQRRGDGSSSGTLSTSLAQVVKGMVAADKDARTVEKDSAEESKLAKRFGSHGGILKRFGNKKKNAEVSTEQIASSADPHVQSKKEKKGLEWISKKESELAAEKKKLAAEKKKSGEEAQSEEAQSEEAIREEAEYAWKILCETNSCCPIVFLEVSHTISAYLWSDPVSVSPGCCVTREEPSQCSARCVLRLREDQARRDVDHVAQAQRQGRGVLEPR
jgi:hypothetical protein